MLRVIVKMTAVGAVSIGFHGGRGAGKTYLRRHVENRMRLIGKIEESRSVQVDLDILRVVALSDDMTLDDVKSIVSQIADDKAKINNVHVS